MITFNFILLTGFTIIVWPSVAKDNPIRLRYQVQIVTKDERLAQPISGAFQPFRPGAEEVVRVSASHHRFGVTEDANMLQHPLRFDIIINWFPSEVDCPPLGCPVMDPREKHSEVFNGSASLKSGEKITILTKERNHTSNVKLLVI